MKTIEHIAHLRDLQKIRRQPPDTVYIPAHQLRVGDRFTFLGDPFTATQVIVREWMTIHAEYGSSAVIVEHLHHELIQVHLPRPRKEATT